ncbi:MAG: hypothetical protein HC819_11975 [Cyclobacteriaceae bacterium]|nr:hypothetical protein [Cyclobacteriaceae bacterium]
MNEYLLKAIIRLFAIVAKGNVTDESRERIKFIVYRQASSENAEEYLKIFEEFTCQVIEKQYAPPAQGEWAWIRRQKSLWKSGPISCSFASASISKAPFSKK